jgi:hypothetical protein
MHKDPRFSGLFLNLDRGSATPPSLWQKIVGGVAALGVFALALTFSVALFAVVITVGVVVWGYLWWKTRAVRKAMREHMAAEMEARRAAGAAHSGGAAATRGLIIEGEVIREVKIDEPPAAEGGIAHEAGRRSRPPVRAGPERRRMLRAGANGVLCAHRGRTPRP